MESDKRGETRTLKVDMESGTVRTLDRMLKWFDFNHLSGDLRDTSETFNTLARYVCDTIEPGPERTVALRKLLEAKDAAVRAVVHPGG